MPKVITVSNLQRHIGKLMEFVGRSWVIVTSKGKAQFIMLPYFDDNDDAVAEYLEEYEMHQNAPALRKRYEESLDSGASDLSI